MKHLRLEVIGIDGLPEIETGFCIGELIVVACIKQDTPIIGGDILIVTQKIVSKSEGKLVDLNEINPSSFAKRFSAASNRDPRLVELVLRESQNVIRADINRGILITETKHGFICANAGIDSSNILGDNIVSLLPDNPDESARLIRSDVKKACGVDVPVIITDTFGRPWREGHINFAIGLSGIDPIRDDRGLPDATGRIMSVTRIAEADEIAAASELVMSKSIGVPAAVVRGHIYSRSNEGSGQLLRDKANDLFR